MREKSEEKGGREEEREEAFLRVAALTSVYRDVGRRVDSGSRRPLLAGGGRAEHMWWAAGGPRRAGCRAWGRVFPVAPLHGRVEGVEVPASMFIVQKGGGGEKEWG